MHSQELDRASRNAIRPAVVGVVALVVAIAFALAIREWSTARPQPSDEEITSEYLSVSPPSGTHAGKAYEVHSKHGAVSVTNRHAASISADSVLREYREVLLQHGWKYRMSFSDGRRWGDDYCKGNLLASVEIMKRQGQEAEYVFSVSWSGVSERECL